MMDTNNPTLYALSLNAAKLPRDVFTCASYALAVSEEDAKGQGIQIALELYPPTEGYIMHGADAMELPRKLLAADLLSQVACLVGFGLPKTPSDNEWPTLIG